MFKKYVSDLKAEFKGYNGKKLTQDLMAGLTVAAVALPLALAFGVSSGADAASGLVTAIVAGIVIGILSGASYQISGPTGAMAAILLSVSAKYGITGVLTAGFLSGAILIIAAVCRVGKLVSYLPAPVITGFTSGIAIIIALGQIDNFFGTHSVGENQIAKIGSYFSGTGNFNPNWWAVMFGGLVVLIMIVYPKKWNAVVPSSLVGIIVALIVNMVFFEQGTVAEVGAIPSSLVTDDSIIRKGFDFANITNLIMPAVSIAALGMIESLLCGASAGKMKGERLGKPRADRAGNRQYGYPAARRSSRHCGYCENLRCDKVRRTDQTCKRFPFGCAYSFDVPARRRYEPYPDGCACGRADGNCLQNERLGGDQEHF